MEKWNGNFLDNTPNNHCFTEGAIPFLHLGQAYEVDKKRGKVCTICASKLKYDDRKNGQKKVPQSKT